MGAWFQDFNGVEYFFLLCAVVGGVFVLIRMILLFLGHAVDAGADMAGHEIDLQHADSDVGFKIISLQGLSAFLMMFGLVGLALYRESGVGILISMAGGLGGGLAAVWVIGRLFRLFAALQSSGTTAIESAVGAEGKVYTTIPENGTGRVLVRLPNGLREYDAAAGDRGRLETGTPIRVLWVEGNLLMVERIS